MRQSLILVLGFTVVACVSVDEPIQTGRDSYMINADAFGAMVSKGTVTSRAAQKASEFCSKQGKVVQITSTQSSGVRGFVPADGSVNFMCLDANDPAYTRNKFRPTPNVVIENRATE